VGLFLIFVLLGATHAWAQGGAANSTVTPPQGAAEPAEESRETILADRQAAKLKISRPPQPNKAEKYVRKLEGTFLEDRAGFYPFFGSVYHGGGLTAGAGYRRYYADNSYWDLKGLYSVKNYKKLELATESKDHLDRRVSFGSRLGWRDATQVNYFGLGVQSRPEDRSNFRFQEAYADGHVTYRPVRWVPLRGNVAFEYYDTKEGQAQTSPSIERLFTPATAPGLGADPAYLHTQLAAGIDWRQSPGYTRKGGLYEITFHDYHNTNSGGAYSFKRLDGDLIQHLPLLRETWVLSLRGRVETTLNDNDLVPYFLMPALGSGRTLRAFRSDRFRDRHSLLMTAEFRWIPNPWGLDMALFYDAGKVTSRRSDLNLKSLKSNIGIGARFHGPFSTPLRVELAVGNEGWNLVISGDAVF
jgi:outer membrane protein assembly factor BamA